MRTANLTLLSGAVAALIVSGCATNALRIEAAADVAAKGRTTAALARGFLGEVEDQRYATNVDIIAADAACRDHRATIRRVPRIPEGGDATNPPRGWLCERLPDTASTSRALMLAPIGSQMNPTLRLIQALADYSSAITKILDAPAPDPAADIANALETARSAEGLLNALRNGTATGLPAVDDPRLNAVTGFISFLSELANERVTVNRLRELRQRTGGGAPIIGVLIDHLETWNQSRDANEEFTIDLSNAVLTAATQPSLPISSERRRRFAEDYYKRVRAQASSDQLHSALRVTLNALRQAELDYDQLLAEHPQLTREQRSRRAEIIRQRLTRAFDLATSIITSFRG